MRAKDRMKKNKFFPFFGAKGGSNQTDTSLWRGTESPKETIDKLLNS